MTRRLEAPADLDAFWEQTLAETRAHSTSTRW